MELVLPTSASEYIHVPDIEDYITKSTVLQGHNWLQQHKLLQENKAVMITPNGSLTLDQALLGMKGKVFGGAGNLIDESELQRVFNERHEIRSPWRAENLDALFEEIGHLFSERRVYLNQNHEYMSQNHGYMGGISISNIILDPKYSQKLDPDTLMEEKTIDLTHFIKEAHTSQGLPRGDVKRGDFWYCPPISGKVAGLGAGSDGADLSCYGGPSGLDARLGVRAKISTGNLKQFLEELKDTYKR